MLAPLSVAGARLRAHPARAALVVFGVAAASAFLAAVLGASLIAQDRELRRAVAALPLSERAFRIDAFGLVSGRGYGATERRARDALAVLTRKPPLRASFFRPLDIDGELVELASIDRLATVVRLRTGRLPGPCLPTRCEVLQIGARGRPTLAQPGIRLVRTGTGELAGKALFGSSLQATLATQDRAALVVANGADAYRRVAGLAGFPVVRSWIAPLAPADLHVWQVSSVLARETRVQAALAPYEGTFALSGPDDALTAARHDGAVSAERMLLVGSEIGALLLGFAIVSAVGLRRGVGNEARRLRQRGAASWQIATAVAGELGALTTLGVVAGACIGVGAVWLSASAAGLPAGATILHSLATWRGAAVAGATWLGATIAVVAAVVVPERGAKRRVTPLDVLALGAAATTAFAIARGGLNANANRSSGEETFLLALPSLICLVAAAVAARVLAPLMRLGERLARSSPIAMRLALVALARSPARTAMTAAFLVVSLGLALFAGDYRATLSRNARDEAGFAVPLSYTLAEGQRLVRPLEAAPLARYRTLASGVVPYPVLRQTAEVPGPGTTVLSPTVVGVPAAAVAKLSWRPDNADVSQAELARRLAAAGPATLRSLALPRGTETARLVGSVRGSAAVSVALVVELLNGDVTTLQMGVPSRTRRMLATHVPASVGRVVGLQVLQASGQSTETAHRQAETGAAPVLGGSFTFGPLVATLRDGRRRTLTDWHGWLARGGALHAGAAARLSYTFTTGQPVVVRLPQPTDDRALPVVVSPDVARAGGTAGSLTLSFEDVEVPARIVGVARRFPAAEQDGGGFVVADESRLSTALDAGAPGTGTPGELWLAVPPRSVAAVGGALRASPFSALQVSSQRALEHSLAGDPLARGIDLTLGGAGLIALVLAAVGLWVTTGSDLNDERGEYFDLEAQGVAPEVLRRQLRVRGLLLAGFGIAGGVALGVLLARIVVLVVKVSATASLPEPPLRLDAAWGTAAIGLAAVAAAAVAGIELSTRRAFADESPRPAPWSLE